MIFYGPEGCGKKTRVINFIQEVYGVSSLTLVEEIRSFKLENPNKNIEYTLISSNVHIEITPADN
jgi:replication factor C subunit 3/5